MGTGNSIFSDDGYDPADDYVFDPNDLTDEEELEMSKSYNDEMQKRDKRNEQARERYRLKKIAKELGYDI